MAIKKEESVLKQEKYKVLPILDSDKNKLPLCLRKILYIDFVDADVPYKIMANEYTNGRIYGQHSTRKISTIINYIEIANLHKKST